MPRRIDQDPFLTPLNGFEIFMVARRENLMFLVSIPDPKKMFSRACSLSLLEDEVRVSVERVPLV